MADNGAYSDLLENSIPDIKDAVRDQDIDMDALLAQERAGQNRKTLVSWIEDQIDDAANDSTPDTPTEESEAVDTAPDPLPDMNTALTRYVDSPAVILLLGVLVGALVTGAVFLAFAPNSTMGAAGGDTVQPAAAGSNVAGFLEANRDAMRIPPTVQFAVANVSAMEDAPFYEANVEFTADVQNQTVTQSMPVYLTRDGDYVFFSRPWSTTADLSDQVQLQ